MTTENKNAVGATHSDTVTHSDLSMAARNLTARW